MVHLRRQYVVGALAAVGLLFSPAVAVAASAERGCAIDGCQAREDGAERAEHGRGERERGRDRDRGDERCEEDDRNGRRDQRFGERSPGSSSSVASSSSIADDDAGDDECPLPPPVIPEAPWPALLPLSAAGTAIIVLRRRSRRSLAA